MLPLSLFSTLFIIGCNCNHFRKKYTSKDKYSFLFRYRVQGVTLIQLDPVDRATLDQKMKEYVFFKTFFKQ
jgi:hypothetical protein